MWMISARKTESTSLISPPGRRDRMLSHLDTPKTCLWWNTKNMRNYILAGTTGTLPRRTIPEKQLKCEGGKIMNIVNLTPHALNLMPAGPTGPVVAIPLSGQVARCAVDRKQ